MDDNSIIESRKLSQQYAYASLQMHEAIARKAGFSGTDHKYLGFLLQKGKLTAGDLAELSGLTTGAVTGLINRFEKKGLVKREYDERDRRKVLIVADYEKIVKILEPFYRQFQEESEKLLATFSASEIATIQSFLLKGISLMKATHNKFKE
jgi:DNA-binding MarR family transcriptional regulator